MGCRALKYLLGGLGSEPKRAQPPAGTDVPVGDRRWVGRSMEAAALGRFVAAGILPGLRSANGIGRFSGWRYDLPADWVAYFYFAVGAAQIFWVMAGVLGRKADEIAGLSRDDVGTAFRWRTAGLLVAAFGLVGALPWIVQGIAAPRERGPNALGAHGETGWIAGCPSPGSQAGRYPDVYCRASGDASDRPSALPALLHTGRRTGIGDPWPAYAPREFPRLGFVLLNQSRHDAVMPLRQVGHGFTQGADAIILGCQRQDYIEVRLILFPDSDLGLSEHAFREDV